MLTKRVFLRYQYNQIVNKLAVLYNSNEEKSRFITRCQDMDIAGEFLLSVLLEGKFNPFLVSEILLLKLGVSIAHISIVLGNVNQCILHIDR